MRFTHRLRLTMARIVLLAMLFAAASPTVATALYQGQADVTGRILGVPAAAPAAADDHHDCHEPSQGGTSDERHTAHGIYCSFCLPAASHALTAERAPVEATPAPTIASVLVAREQIFHALLLPAAYNSRGPPALSR